MFDISFPVAFFSGVISFFAPCVVTLLPTYVAYVSGVSFSELRERGIATYQSKLFLSSLLYIAGFSLIFVLLGTAVAEIGGILRTYQFWIERVGGIFIIIFGLQFAGFLHISLLMRRFSYQLPPSIEKLERVRSFFIGILFAIVWTPCVGIVLGSILTLAAVKGTALQGALLLFTYSLGISIPFLLVAATLAQAPRYISFISQNIHILSRLAGLLLVVIGILLLTDTYKYVNSWIFSIAFSLGYQIK